MVRKRKKTANKKKNGKKDVKKLTVQQTIAYKEMGKPSSDNDIQLMVYSIRE